MDDKLKVNKRVELEIKEGVYQGTYISRVEDIGPDYVALSIPMDGKGYIPLRIGTGLRISVIGERALFAFHSQIKERLKDPIPVILVDRPEELERIQRRRFVRLEITMQLEYCLMPDGDAEEEELEFTQGEMIDISGGGLQLKIQTREKIEAGCIVKVKMDSFLPLKEEEGEQLARVMWSKKDDDCCYLGLEFTDIGQHLQDQIMGWIFEKQRELRKKGLI